MSEPDDRTLLIQYAGGDESAFTALFQRHVHLVYSAALRQARNPSHAEEVTQAVFILLARKAKSLGPKTILSGWLYQAARLTMASLIKREIRRQRREQEVYMQTLTEPDISLWEQVSPLLDDAMGRLGEKDRNAIVLRFFENRTPQEVAAALKLNEVTARKRVSRALEKLRKFFAKRGVVLTAAIIAGTISGNSVQAAPVALANSATAVAIAKGAAASASTLTLVKGALKVMAWTKAKTAITVGAVVILTAGSTTIAMKKFLAPITIRDAYVKLYTEPYYGGEVLTDLPWEASSNDVAVRGDIANFDGLPPDSRDAFDFNDKATSAVYLLPKGCTVVLYEAARFDGQQFKLVGTGKVEKIPDFDTTHPGFDDIASSLHWEGVKEAAWRRSQPPVDISQITNSPGFSLTEEAVAYLHQLRIEGRLPGVQKDETILLLLPTVSSNAITYPVARDFQGRKTNIAGPFPYHYTVIKSSPVSAWQLQKAWHTDKTGKILEEYPVP